MIKVLDSFIADKIAAGEVIERPLSIVKELVENSVDANASSIFVEIKNGGKSYIRVTDNGSGIPAEEVELAFLRHATGKISKLEDLDSISTLGFRGEALASISAVSRLTIVTKDASSVSGVKINMHGGNIVNRETVGCNVGTTLIVEDVFYNIPARRKFMRSDAAEASAIIDLIQKLAIYYANIRFVLINNGQTILSTDGNGDYIKTIRTIYPSPEYANLIEIKGDGIHGFISDPGTTKSNRRGQIFFVNGRIVDSSTVEKGILKGYGDRIFSGYPISILFITVNPFDIDVNIHPGKKEIKFLRENDVVELISAAIQSSLHSSASVPSAILKKVDTSQFEEKTDSESQLGIQDYLSSISSEVKTGIRLEENEISVYDYDYDNDKDDDSIIINNAVSRPFDFNELSLCGYFFNSYILTQAKDNLYIFDQHAAHERIFYERLIEGYNSDTKLSQPILTPIIIETSPDIYMGERQFIDSLCRMGYQIEDFGPGTFIVKSIPQYMQLGEADTFARAYIEGFKDFSKDNRSVVDKLITRSCKMAVKANDKLSEKEILNLLGELSKCKNPFSCPHGRPTFIKISKYEVERAFKRK